MTIKLRIMSDLHEEHGGSQYKFPHDKLAGKNQILILAGDSSHSRGIIKFIKQLETSRFNKVLFVAGNHEFYGGHFYDTLKKLKKNFPAKENKIAFLDNQMVTIDDVNFLGCTLWTDFNKKDPICIESARRFMNDYQLIKFDSGAVDTYSMGHTNFSPEDSYKEHEISLRFLEEKLKLSQENKQSAVVITHMAPSSLSVHEMYKQPPYNDLNGAYYSDLSELILNYEPILWIHGHTHTSFDYMIGNTRVICNPQGYLSDPNHSFIKELIIDVE
jgi:Icc-related predicted phosphoesterase